jgi:FkbM family methyltransferase
MKTLKRRLGKVRKQRKHLRFSDFTSCLYDAALNRSRTIQIEIGSQKLFVRTNSPDVEVATTILAGKEYVGIDLTNPRIIIDAGANIGASTIYFARRFPSAYVIAIEPELENFRLLERNLCGYPNVKLINAALWGSKETRSIVSRATGSVGFTIVETEANRVQTGQEIKCITMTDLMGDLPNDCVDLLKMDIEGAEKNVLENSQAWIDRVRVLTAELHDRIVFGCTRAFYLATKDYSRFDQQGEKITAYR